MMALKAPNLRPFGSAKPVAAPSIGLPLRFVMTGILSLVVGISLLILRPEILAGYHYNQAVIAVTHLFTLGWLCSIVMGAMYQLVPVALETTLYSERLGRWQFVLHVTGVTGMVSMFWIWKLSLVGLFGACFGLGVLVFVYNIGRTLLGIPRWNVVAVAIASALTWLLGTVCLGLFLVASKLWNVNLFAPLAQMHAHAHMGVVGFFIMMTLGVSYKLVPMFTLSELQNPRRAWWSICLLNVGLAGAWPCILLGSGYKLLFAAVIVAALIVYAFELCAILKARKRRDLDWGLRYFLTALATLVPVAALGVALAWPKLPLTALTGQLENVYGFLAVVGVLSFAILGMLYKIVPFLVWYSSYSKEIGRHKVPSLAELYSPTLQVWGYWLFVAGLVGASMATACGSERSVRITCGLLAGSILLFALNVLRILWHMFRPQIQPLPLPQARAGTAGV